ncbi:hypothetical protein BBK36DRAFT_1144909 [Trichoderma citrinoviride]|uniref:Uncharacterized protein n=1 Tax=Trichoderma citrinoviride TaxID=58853 RepID=A0A2T4AZI9_9HYPO|nr:hypothetical protein BBK36DRAFT_1144909 [Trichoderma citrinoviride]PTB62484.1 hypothetical protein BBK36DRAFT_1144909 [Trichoderma citrinoviride]
MVKSSCENWKAKGTKYKAESMLACGLDAKMRLSSEASEPRASLVVPRRRSVGVPELVKGDPERCWEIPTCKSTAPPPAPPPPPPPYLHLQSGVGRGVPSHAKLKVPNRASERSAMPMTQQYGRLENPCPLEGPAAAG